MPVTVEGLAVAPTDDGKIGYWLVMLTLVEPQIDPLVARTVAEPEAAQTGTLYSPLALIEPAQEEIVHVHGG